MVGRGKDSVDAYADILYDRDGRIVRSDVGVIPPGKHDGDGYVHGIVPLMAAGADVTNLVTDEVSDELPKFLLHTYTTFQCANSEEFEVIITD